MLGVMTFFYSLILWYIIICLPFMKSSSVYPVLKDIQNNALKQLCSQHLENSMSCYHGCHSDTTADLEQPFLFP